MQNGEYFEPIFSNVSSLGCPDSLVALELWTGRLGIPENLDSLDSLEFPVGLVC